MSTDVTSTPIADELPAQRGGAKSLLLTVLGEFVLPAGGAAWTSSLVGAADALGISEKNARQAIARIGEQGLIASGRHGRQVRWTLTEEGRELLQSGTRRIYEFGTSRVDWGGEWLVAHCQVAESQRPLRIQLRTQLGFLGFGELSPSLLVSPHVDRESQLRDVLRQLGLSSESIILRSTTTSPEEDGALVDRAWDLDDLATSYRAFIRSHASRRQPDDTGSFRALVELVHDWRRFPSIDPELPTNLLPESWAGAAAATTFREQHAAWAPAARTWFSELESAHRKAS